MKNIINRILNYKLFTSKLGDKYFQIPVVLGKTIESKWFGDTNQQINILKYWCILWFNGISIYNDGKRIERIQRSYIYYILNWLFNRVTVFFDNILSIIGAGLISFILLKYFDIIL